MEVSVVIDSAVAKQLNITLNANTTSFQSGILLGISYPPDPTLSDTEQRATLEVIATIPCPEENPGQDPPSDVDVEWHSHHAQQVSRMIPGGLRVIGVYNSHTNAALHNAVYRAVRALHLSPSSHFVVLNAEKSDKLTAKALPVDEKRDCLANRSEALVTIKDTDLLSGLSSISATVPFATGLTTVIANPKALKRCFLARTKSTQRIRDGLLPSLQAFKNKSARDMILINPTSAAPLPLGATLLPGSEVSVRLSFKQRRFVAPLEGDSKDGKELAQILGSVRLRAYVSGDASLGQVKAALLEDLFRSVYSRLDILLDEVVDAPEEFEREEWQDLGDDMLRAFAKGGTVDVPGRLEFPVAVGSSTHVMLSDYKSVDEQLDEVLERISELVPTLLTADDLTLCEVASKRSQEQDEASDSAQNESTTSSVSAGGRSVWLYVGMALIALLLAVVIQMGLSGGKV